MTFKLTFCAALALASAISAQGAAAETLRIATVVSAPHPWIDAAEVFKAEVEENTDFTVEIFPGGQLGDDATVVDEMRIGTVDVMIGGVQNIAPFVREFEFFSLNYLFGDMDVFRAATDSDSEIFTYYSQRVEDADVGLKLLAFTGGGTRNLSTSHAPVTSPDDLEGVRMRVTGSRLDAETWGAVGAVTTSLPWTELYTAVQTGVASAFESTISGYFGSRLYEVAPYHSKTEHQIMMSHISMASLRYDRLSDEDRETIERAALLAARHGTDQGVHYDGELLGQLEERGVTISEVDKDAFIAAAAPLHEEYAKSLGLVDLLDVVRDMH